MAKEIEYKFLVTNIEELAKLTPTRYETIKQGYLTSPKQLSSTIRVRTSVLNDGTVESFITVKSAAKGMTRDEYEYPIPQEDAEAMMKLCEGRLIQKTRYFFPYEGRTIELDIFEGRLQGLMIAEIEVESEDAKVKFPAWFEEDVTTDFRYTNVALAER